jgi:hypothetical protein
MNDDPNYCSTCYGEAKKHGRPVRTTDIYPYPLCSTCEQRMRNGLVRYHPSNGTEAMMFEERCDRCRHNIDNGESFPDLSKKPVICAWGVRDRLMHQMATDMDHIDKWFDPADLRTECDDGSPMCPAECLRFTHKGDEDGDKRDPPKPDCEGQMFLGELLTVPEVVSVRVQVAGLPWAEPEDRR